MGDLREEWIIIDFMLLLFVVIYDLIIIKLNYIIVVLKIFNKIFKLYIFWCNDIYGY